MPWRFLLIGYEPISCSTARFGRSGGGEIENLSVFLLEELDEPILHSKADDVIPYADSEELVRNSGLPASSLVEVGTDHRLAEPEPLAAMLRVCEEL